MAKFLKKLKYLPKNILVTRTDQIGDFIMSLPVFEVLKEQLKLNFTVLCQEVVTPLLKNNPFVENVISISPDSSNDHLSQKLIESSFDALLVLVNDPLLLSVFHQIKKIPIRIGPLSKPKSLFQFTHPVIQKRSKSILNEAEYNLELLKLFDPNINVQIKPKVYIQSDEQDQFRTRFPELNFGKRKTVIFHSGMSGSALNWNKSNYTELFLELNQMDINIILTGNSALEQERNTELFQKVDNINVYNFTGKLNLRDLAVLYSMSDIYIGPSTGPTHIANAVDLKVFSFFPPIKVQSKQRWQPYLGESEIFTPEVECGQKYKCIKQKCPYYDCMDLLTVSEVLKALKKHI